MKKFLLTAVSMALVSLTWVPIGTVSAQEETDKKFSFGFVVRVAANEVIVKEFDYETDEGIEVSYLVNAETTFENVASVSELKELDDVEIEYKEEGGKRIVLWLSKVLNYDEEEGSYDDQGEESSADDVDPTVGTVNAE